MRLGAGDDLPITPVLFRRWARGAGPVGTRPCLHEPGSPQPCFTGTVMTTCACEEGDDDDRG